MEAVARLSLSSISPSHHTDCALLTTRTGPCPPCAVTTLHRCFCGSQEIATRCSQLSSKPPSTLDGTLSGLTNGISCGSTCGNTLSCGVHKCEKLCHPGDCGACDVRVEAKCYCGKSQRDAKCGEGIKKISTQEDGTSWEGTWTCERECLKLFDVSRTACRRDVCALLTPPSLFAVRQALMQEAMPPSRARNDHLPLLARSRLYLPMRCRASRRASLVRGSHRDVRQAMQQAPGVRP